MIAARASLFRFQNYITDYRTALGRGHPMQYDAELGYVPRPNYSGKENLDGVQFTYSADGLRLHHIGAPPRVETPAILAVGDSFVQGAEVEDNSSWPAHLQRALDRRVHNGGVGGYGLDQITLRAERLVPSLKPAVLLLGFIPDDIDRTELNTRNGVAKPYFRIVDGGLRRFNAPVPPPDPAAGKLDPVRQILGYSYLVDFTMRRLGFLDYWYGGVAGEHRAHSDGPAVACLLMKRAAALKAAHDVRVIVVAQYPPQVWTQPPFQREQTRRAADVLDCARKAGLETLDTFEGVRAVVARDGHGPYYINGHMNGAGNKLVA
ncbi:MAG: hypothetical protein JNL07_12385, partial [Rhodospirillales bacterium]|nr:hypothetical protein [Rhodospirillales bacterium]